jgi:hypothetical protein
MLASGIPREGYETRFWTFKCHWLIMQELKFENSEIKIPRYWMLPHTLPRSSLIKGEEIRTFSAASTGLGHVTSDEAQRSGEKRKYILHHIRIHRFSTECGEPFFAS